MKQGWSRNKKLDDYQALLLASIGAVLVWCWMGLGLCTTWFDEFLYALYPVSLVLAVFMVRHYNLLRRSEDGSD